MVVVRVGAVQVTTVEVDDEGMWEIAESLALAPGLHDLIVEMQDAEGRLLSAWDPIPFEIPASAVTPPVVAVPPTMNASASDGMVVLEGKGTPGSTVQIVVDGEVVETVTVGEDGTWRAEFALDPGEHQIRAQAVDAQGTVLAEG